MKNYARYAFAAAFIIGVIVILVLGFKLIAGLFDNDPEPEQQQTTSKSDLNKARQEGKPVRYTIVGSVVGEEQHRSIRITVDRSIRRAEVLQGYNGQVIKTQESPNTTAAYDAFVAALNGANFTRTVQLRGGQEAEVCPLGRKFSYEIAPGTADEFRSWSTTCGVRQGTFGGNSSTIQSLFQKQIPKYSTFTEGVSLSGEND